MSSTSNDSLFCREQVARSNRLSLLAQVFAAAERREALVALYALFSVIEQVCSGSKEEDVAIKRLAWWRDELNNSLNAQGVHPLGKELIRTGAASRISMKHIDQLLLSAQARLESPVIGDTAALKQLCLETGWPLVELEWALCGRDSNQPGLEGLAVRAGLAQLIRESAGENAHQMWWIPMNLLARHGLARNRLDEPSLDEAATALSRELLSMEGCNDRQAEPRCDDISTGEADLRHFFVLDALYARKFRKLEKATPLNLREGLLKVGPADVFAAWRAARTVNRLR